MKPASVYIVMEYNGVYEIARMDDAATCTVVQTNILSHEKAMEARKRWQEHEMALGERPA